MNVFYYPAVACKEADFCRQALQKEHSLHAMIVLPGGCQLNSPFSLKLRSGDIMILFAADLAELDELLVLRDSFEDFRVILIMQEPCSESCREKAHLLKPRFVTIPQDIDGLAAVIDKMLFRDEARDAATILSKEDKL